jgi:hypothetical protein
MMAPWTKLLPFFFVEWFARRYCERVDIYMGQYAIAYRGGILIKIRADEKGAKA